MTAKPASRSNLPALTTETPLAGQPPVLILFGHGRGERLHKLTDAAVAVRLASLASGEIAVTAIAERLGASCYSFLAYFPRARSSAQTGR